MSQPARRRQRRGFSLIEVLLAVFILGIGIISIGAIFPAGIVQQRQSLDDALGPIVADNALATLRAKLSQKDFGFAEDFEGFPLGLLDLASYEGSYGDVDPAAPRTLGDWGWRRPALALANISSFQTNYPSLGGGEPTVEAGSMIVFNTIGRPENVAPGSQMTISEVPWNRRKFGPAANDGSPGGFPLVVFEPWERAYPSFAPGTPEAASTRPEYFWECMFRRFQGRVQVAIFVYRVSGAEQLGGYAPSQAATFAGASRSALPYRIDLAVPWRVTPANNLDPTVINGTAPNSLLQLENLDYHWQLPGQWLLDPNGNVHRVASGRRVKQDGPVRLMTPLPRLPDPTGDPSRAMRSFWFMGDESGDVGTFWYLPAEDDRGYRLTPVYVSVKEL
ncbi:MAG: type IV pilus modification PilV family protein [Phycisphaerales bacterium]